MEQPNASPMHLQASAALFDIALFIMSASFPIGSLAWALVDSLLNKKQEKNMHSALQI